MSVRSCSAAALKHLPICRLHVSGSLEALLEELKLTAVSKHVPGAWEGFRPSSATSTHHSVSHLAFIHVLSYLHMYVLSYSHMSCRIHTCPTCRTPQSLVPLVDAMRLRSWKVLKLRASLKSCSSSSMPCRYFR